MFRLTVISMWTQSVDPLRPDNIYPKVIDLMTTGKIIDVTRQPTENIMPEPNSVTVECIVSQETLDILAASPDVFILSEEAV